MTEDQIKKHKMLTFLMVNMVGVYLADELAGEYITMDVKMTFNRYFETFMKRNKQKIETMFDMVTDDGQERGDTFLEAQTYVEMIIKDIADLHVLKELKETPIYMYPGLAELIREYRIKSYESMGEPKEKLNLDEGEE